MKRIQAADVLFLDAESPQTPPLIGGLVILDPATAPGSFVRHRDILKYVGDRLHLAPNLRKRLAFNPLKIDEPRLVDDVNFDLEFHVRHIGLPRPRDRRQLNILAARLMSRPMDLARPLWELYIIEGLEAVDGYPEDAYAIMIKVHHAAFDGAATAAVIWSLLQDSPEAEPSPPPGGAWMPARSPRALDWATSTITEAMSQFASNLQALPTLGTGALQGALAGSSEIGSLAVPNTRFQGEITSHRVFDWVIFPQSEFRAIRAAVGNPKMNDVVLCLIAGAMRRYLGAKGELPGETMLALCPINVRSGDAKDGGNHVTAMRVALGSNIADPIDRIKAITASCEQGKKQAEKLGGSFFGDLMALYPYPLRSAMIRGAQAVASAGNSPMQMANLIITNIPNPKGTYYFAGSKVVAYAGFGPIVAGYGLFHTVSGMEWEMSVSVTSCREIMPDIDFYMECLQASFEELRQLVPANQNKAPDASVKLDNGARI
jgi:diacylglycerol O-acyltransferase